MKVLEKKSIETDILIDILCDVCGKSCNSFAEQANYPVIFNYLELSADWGYGSKLDGEEWKAQVCVDCAKEKFDFVNFSKESSF
jgi:hypothetical protein